LDNRRENYPKSFAFVRLLSLQSNEIKFVFEWYAPTWVQVDLGSTSLGLSKLLI